MKYLHHCPVCAFNGYDSWIWSDYIPKNVWHNGNCQGSYTRLGNFDYDKTLNYLIEQDFYTVRKLNIRWF